MIPSAGYRTLLDARLAESARLAAQAQTSQAEDEERAA